MPRGDGRLTHDLDPQDRGPQDACGVFGVWAPGEEVAKLTYFGLYALQHRGQESAGIAVSNGSPDPGLQGHGPGLAGLRRGRRSSRSAGHLAIGHCRYSTTGSSVWQNAQPTFRPTAGGRIALGHNGNLTNTARAAERWLESASRRRRASPDPRRARAGDARDHPTPALITALLATYPDRSIEEAAVEVLPRAARAPSPWCSWTRTPLYAARDPQGIRPLVLGRLERGWVVASETAALDIVGASYVREIEPGELVAIDEHGLRIAALRRGRAQGLPVRVRLPRPPDTTIAGQRRARVRVEVGRRLAREHPVEADLVIPVPESGHARRRSATPRQSGIPYGAGPGQELLRRPHLHPAQPDHPPARHPAQAQPAARRDRRQAAGRGRRLDRPRQHPARPGPDAARGRRGRGARADLVAAGEVALLLRHRLRQPRRADRQRAQRRRDLPLDRRRLAGLRRRWTGWSPRPRSAEGQAVPRLLRRRLPGRAAASDASAASTCSRSPAEPSSSPVR